MLGLEVEGRMGERMKRIREMIEKSIIKGKEKGEVNLDDRMKALERNLKERENEVGRR